MKINRWKPIALLAALVLIYLGASYRVFHVRTGPRRSADKVVIRVAYGDSHQAIGGALKAIAADYMRTHPRVQIAVQQVPSQIYLQYLRTQLVGDTAPDILQIENNLTGMAQMRNRYFLPITRWLREPNPYNAGTPLAAVPWRETFVDGLSGPDAYSADLRNYYGVSLTMNTVRIFYNRDLLQQATGRTAPPRTFSELLATCRAIEAYKARTGRKIAPFAGGELPALFLMAPVFSAVNQKLYLDIDHRLTLALDWWDYAKAYLRGRWSFESPSIRLGYQLMRELGQYQKPGYMSLTDSDALFQFMQGQSVMLTAATWDAASMKSQASFPIGAFPIPVPSPTDPVYGRYVLGPVSEAGVGTGLVMGVVVRSPHQAIAIDFLRFLSSKRSDEQFAQLTGWLPAIDGAKVPESAEAYKPVVLGYPGRFLAEMNGLGDARYVFNTNLYLIFSPDGGAAAFCRQMAQLYGPEMAVDLAQHVRDVLQNVGRQELPILATGQLARLPVAQQPAGAPEGSWSDDHGQMISAQNTAEAEALQTRYLLWKYPPRAQSGG